MFLQIYATIFLLKIETVNPKQFLTVIFITSLVSILYYLKFNFMINTNPTKS